MKENVPCITPRTACLHAGGGGGGCGSFIHHFIPVLKTGLSACFSLQPGPRVSRGAMGGGIGWCPVLAVGGHQLSAPVPSGPLSVGHGQDGDGDDGFSPGWWACPPRL